MWEAPSSLAQTDVVGSLVDAGDWAVSRDPGTQMGARKSFGREGVNYGDQEWWTPRGVGMWVTCLCGQADLGADHSWSQSETLRSDPRLGS